MSREECVATPDPPTLSPVCLLCDTRLETEVRVSLPSTVSHWSPYSNSQRSERVGETP